jgi:hypothetical protein
MMIRLAKIFFAFIFIVTVSSCDRKSCKNVACPAGQACNNGQCYCPDGLEGPNCDINSYEKYTGLFGNVSESCNVPPPFSTNNFNITWNGNRLNQIQINGLMGNNCYDIGAIIHTDNNNEGNILEIPEQHCGASTISGQGTYDKINRRVNLQLYYNDGFTSYQCNTILY